MHCHLLRNIIIKVLSVSLRGKVSTSSWATTSNLKLHFTNQFGSNHRECQNQYTLDYLQNFLLNLCVGVCVCLHCLPYFNGGLLNSDFFFLALKKADQPGIEAGSISAYYWFPILKKNKNKWIQWAILFYSLQVDHGKPREREGFCLWNMAAMAAF